MPARKKHLKVYRLYDGPDGPSVQSKWYARISKTIYHVAAYSARQAILLAARMEWSAGGKAGLLEYSDHTQQWFRADGSASWGEAYGHGQRYRGEAPRPADTPAPSGAPPARAESPVRSPTPKQGSLFDE